MLVCFRGEGGGAYAGTVHERCVVQLLYVHYREEVCAVCGGEAMLPGCLLLPGQSTVSVNTVSSVWSNLQCMSAET